MVSAVLTDQNIPIQPDGTTKDIEDLDNVYINISNEIFNLNAGDINYVNGNINRKLVGIQNDFNSNGFTGSSVYANSKELSSTLNLKVVMEIKVLTHFWVVRRVETS